MRKTALVVLVAAFLVMPLSANAAERGAVLLYDAQGE